MNKPLSDELDPKALDVLLNEYVEARLAVRQSNRQTYLAAEERVRAARAAIRDLTAPASQAEVVNDNVEHAIANAFVSGWNWNNNNRGEAEYLHKAARDHADAAMTMLHESASPSLDTGRERVIEECAKIVEDGQETTSNIDGDPERFLTPRKHGNLSGLAYADAIRALSRPIDFPADEIDNAPGQTTGPGETK